MMQRLRYPARTVSAYLGLTLVRYVLLIAAFTATAAAQARGPVGWTASGMERVGQEAAARKKTTAGLIAARGECEPFQVVVSAPESQRGRGKWALSIVREVATDFQNWSDDPVTIERACRKMGEALNRH